MTNSANSDLFGSEPPDEQDGVRTDFFSDDLRRHTSESVKGLVLKIPAEKLEMWPIGIWSYQPKYLQGKYPGTSTMQIPLAGQILTYTPQR